MMKQIFVYITLVFMAAVTMTGCHERYVTYSDAEYVMFADTMAIYPVQAKGAVDKDGNPINLERMVEDRTKGEKADGEDSGTD